MKKTFYFLAMCFALFLSSCEQESSLEGNESLDLTTTINTQVIPNFTPDPCCGEESMFERQLHWFSYLAAEVMVDSPTARGEVKNLLTASGGVKIPIESLIGIGNQAPVFNQLFHARLVWYYDDWTGWPNSSHTNPPWPPGSGGMPGSNTGTFMTDQYYDIMLNENCIEVYFPNGLDFRSTTPSVSSTAHPLTTSGANEGIRFTYSGLINDYYSAEVVVNNSYVAVNKNIIVARPTRSPATPQSGSNCDYLEYDGIIFTDFLD